MFIKLTVTIAIILTMVCRTDKKEIKDALKEHINDFKKPTNFLSVISRHKLDHDHTIDWNNTTRVSQ